MPSSSGRTGLVPVVPFDCLSGSLGHQGYTPFCSSAILALFLGDPLPELSPTNAAADRFSMPGGTLDELSDVPSSSFHVGSYCQPEEPEPRYKQVHGLTAARCQSTAAVASARPEIGKQPSHLNF